MSSDIMELRDHILNINSMIKEEREAALECIDKHKNDSAFLNELLFIYANEDLASTNLVKLRIQLYILLKNVLWPNKLFLKKRIIERWNSADINTKNFIEENALQDVVGTSLALSNSAITFYSVLYKLIPEDHAAAFSLIQEAITNEEYPVLAKYQALKLLQQICETKASIPEDDASRIYTTIYSVLKNPEVELNMNLIDVFISFTSIKMDYFETEKFINELTYLIDAIQQRYPDPTDTSIQFIQKIIKHSIFTTYTIDSELFNKIGSFSVGAIESGEDSVFNGITECWQEIAEFEAEKLSEKKRYDAFYATANVLDISGIEYPYDTPFYRGLSETMIEAAFGLLIQRMTNANNDGFGIDSTSKHAYNLIKALAKVSPGQIQDLLIDVINDDEVKNYPIIAVLSARIIFKYCQDDGTGINATLHKNEIIDMLIFCLLAEDELLKSNALRTFIAAFRSHFVDFTEDLLKFIENLLNVQETATIGITLLSHGVRSSKYKIQDLPEWILKPVVSTLMESQSYEGLFMYLEALAFHISDKSGALQPYEVEVSNVIIAQIKIIIESMKEAISSAPMNDQGGKELGDYLMEMMDGIIKIAKNRLFLLNDELISDVVSLYDLRPIQYWCCDQLLTLLNHLTVHSFNGSNEVIMAIANIAGAAVENGNVDQCACGLLTLCNIASSSCKPLDDPFIASFCDTVKSMNVESDISAYVATAMASILSSFGKKIHPEELLQFFGEIYGLLLDMVSTTDDNEIANEVMLPVLEGYIEMIKIFGGDQQWIYDNRSFLIRPIRVLQYIGKINDRTLIAVGEYFYQVTKTFPSRALIPFAQKDSIRCLLIASSIMTGENILNIFSSLGKITSRKSVFK